MLIFAWKLCPVWCHSNIPNILELKSMDHFWTNGSPLLVIFVDKHMWNFTLTQLNLAWQTIILFSVSAMSISKRGWVDLNNHRVSKMGRTKNTIWQEAVKWVQWEIIGRSMTLYFMWMSLFRSQNLQHIIA